MKTITKDKYWSLIPWEVDGKVKKYPYPGVGKVYREPAKSLPRTGAIFSVTEIIGIESGSDALFPFTKPYTVKRLHVQNFKIRIE